MEIGIRNISTTPVFIKATDNKGTKYINSGNIECVTPQNDSVTSRIQFVIKDEFGGTRRRAAEADNYELNEKLGLNLNTVI